LGIKHAFISLVTDIGGPTYVQPTHWNAPLNAPAFRVWSNDAYGGSLGIASFGIGSTASTGIGYEYAGGSGGAGLMGGNRGSFDFAYVDTVQLYAGLASTNGPVGSAAIRFEYMASGFPGSWYSFDATGGSAPFITVASGNNASLYLASTNGLQRSASVTVSAAAKALPQPLTIRLAGYGGNGSAAMLGNIFILGQ
jgi:hypothetical protein